MRILNKFRIILVSLLLLIVLSGCRTVEVARDLDQFQVNKIIAKLNNLGISAQAETAKSSKGKYNLIVNQSDRLAAITLIDKFQLISKPDSEFDELTKPQGFLPSSRAVENLRLDRALAAELEEIINSLSQVKDSNVLVRLNYLPADSIPAVSLVLEVSSLPDEAEIKNIVINSIPGVSPENIALRFKITDNPGANVNLIGLKKDGQELVPVSLVPFFIWLVPDGVDYELALLVLLLAFMGVVLGLVLGFAFGRKKSKKQNTTMLPEAAAAALQIDTNIIEDQESLR